MIHAGQVYVRVASQWQCVTKASTIFEHDIDIQVKLGEEQRFVSRAGLKLEGALHSLALDITGKVALDIGQSTGGFTDCLLLHGVKKVVGVDVGHGQLAAKFHADPRIICLEGINARELPNELLLKHAETSAFDVIVMDVSFISQTLILSGLYQLLSPKGHLISLVKPQFEVGPANIGKGGIVKDASLYQTAQNTVISAAKSAGFCFKQYLESTIPGGDGNREFILYATR